MGAETTAVQSPARRSSSAGQRWKPLMPWATKLAFVALVLAVWQLLGGRGTLSSVPTASGCLSALAELVGDGSMWSPLGETMKAWSVGLALSAAIAIPIGFLLGASSLAYRMTRLIIDFCRTIPALALLPLAVLLYGSGLGSTLLLTVFACVWPIMLQTIYGVRDIDAVVRETCRSYRVNRWQWRWRVVLPSAGPYIATGLRIAAAISLLLVLSTEILIPVPGIGQAIMVAQLGGAVSEMYAWIVLAGLVGIAINAVLVRLERTVLHWHPSQRKAARP